LSRDHGIVQRGAGGGLHIVEKHNHSRDLWGEEHRTVPLGRDATYVYAVKDLKFANPWNGDVIVRMHTDPAAEILSAAVLARNQQPRERAVRHEIVDEGSTWHVVTTVYDNGSVEPRYRWTERYLKADPKALEAYYRLNENRDNGGATCDGPRESSS